MMAAARFEPGLPLSSLLPGQVSSGAPEDRLVREIASDSRQVAPGTLFMALAGARVHGLDFLRQAMLQGAAAIVCEPGGLWTEEKIKRLRGEIAVPLICQPGLNEQAGHIAARFFDFPSQALKVVGITGTNGKTSCAQFLAQSVSGIARYGVIGTVGYGYLDALKSPTHTTPDAVTLQRLLAEFRAEGAEGVAMEVSSHALHQNRTAGIRFHTAVFTNLSRDHLDYHRDLSEYGEAKSRLFRSPGLGRAVVNYDDPFGRDILRSLTPSVDAIEYSRLHEGEVVRFLAGRRVAARAVDFTPEGMRIRVETAGAVSEFQTPLIGDFNVSNLLAVIAVLLGDGFSLDEAINRVRAVRAVAGRMEMFLGADGVCAVVDYAHTPDALGSALRALRRMVRGRLICVFGCGGNRDRGKRPLMGGIAERLSDGVIVTDDNPRDEDGNLIISEILAGMRKPHRVRVQRDRASAIREGLKLASSGDVVLIAGKGHESYQDIAGRRRYFSDREQVANMLGREASR